ncbi:MAG: ABC transporter ATP-binding protein [Kouleothrix sp.]
MKAQGDLRRVARILGRFLRSTRTTFLMAMLMLLAESGTSIAAKYPIAWLIDYLNKKPAPASLVGLGLSNVIFASLTSVLIFVTIAIVLIALLNSITDSLSEIYLSRGGRRLGFDLRAALFAHLQKLSLAFYSKQRTGDLLTRVTSDVSALETFSIDSLKDIASSIFLLILSMITLFTGSWQIALVALVMVPVLSVVSNYFADRIKTAAKKLRAREGELAASTQEMLTSIRVIQTYGSGGNQLKRFADISQQTVDTALYTARLQAWFGGVFNVLQAVTIVLVVLVGVWLIQGNPTLYTAGQLLVFVGIIQDMFKPTKRIIKQWNEVGKIIASVERISEVLDRQPAVEDAPTAAQAPRFQGFIEFKHVSFAYMPEPEDVKDGAAAPRLALRDVNFTVAPGEVVALVGGSGAGKSTIVQLLPRLYDPHIGTITFDGQDIRSYTLDSLRGQMSMVLQEAILFTGTVAENIAYGRQNATREEIIAAAMQASAHEFIEKLPDGYETMLSERAGNLSGGQRQRIAIARAFIRNTPILILDEPTTGLDAESTELVQLALKSLMRGKATVIISHDLNLIRQADTIIAIKDGAIEQVGSHRELLRRGGLYADLYSKQFGSVVAEQGGQMRADHAVAAPAKPSVPAIPAGSAAQIGDDREEDEVVTPKAFQTLIGRALPRRSLRDLPDADDEGGAGWRSGSGPIRRASARRCAGPGCAWPLTARGPSAAPGAAARCRRHKARRRLPPPAQPAAPVAPPVVPPAPAARPNLPHPLRHQLCRRLPRRLGPTCRTRCATARCPAGCVAARCAAAAAQPVAPKVQPAAPVAAAGCRGPNPPHPLRRQLGQARRRRPQPRPSRRSSRPRLCVRCRPRRPPQPAAPSNTPCSRGTPMAVRPCVSPKTSCTTCVPARRRTPACAPGRRACAASGSTYCIARRSRASSQGSPPRSMPRPCASRSSRCCSARPARTMSSSSASSTRQPTCRARAWRCATTWWPKTASRSRRSSRA